MDAHAFLSALAVTLCVAAVTTLACQWLRQPVVLGYLLAGMIVGPHLPVPVIADRHIIETLSEVGVVMLMFSLGLEFSLRGLLRLGRRPGITALVQCSAMLVFGYVFARVFGWTRREAIFTGAMIAISSTTIIAKAFDEQGKRGELRQFVVGVLIVEDLIAIALMIGLTALASGENATPGQLLLSAGRFAAFLIAVIAAGILFVPRMIRAVRKLGRPETMVITSIGICFLVALLALEFGYSVALGAFIAGSTIAESGEGEYVEEQIRPIKDIFAAVFFVSVGMLIDPKLIGHHALAVGVLTLVVIVGKIVSVAAGALLSGGGRRLAIQAGMSLAQIGEFSFIIAALGTDLNATGDFLYPVAASVSAITTFTTPWLIRAADPVADRLAPNASPTTPRPENEARPRA
jgi:CPA2 family monovalent cation:H+ antiporter-2